MKAVISDFNLVVQISPWLQNTASWTQLSIQKTIIVEKLSKPKILFR